MTEDATVGDSEAAQSHPSWAPMAIIALRQAQISLNISALPISIGGIVADFDTAPTTVGTAIVAHSLAVAAFTMVSAARTEVRVAPRLPHLDGRAARGDGADDRESER